MTKEKELQELKKRCLGLNCNDLDCNNDYYNCPLWNKYSCELTKFKRLVEERFKPKPKLCPTCGKEIK